MTVSLCEPSVVPEHSHVRTSLHQAWEQLPVQSMRFFAVLSPISFVHARHILSCAGGSGGERMSALHAMAAFLAALTNADADGRVIVDDAAGTLRFVLLNAAAHFSKVGAQHSSTTHCPSAHLPFFLIWYMLILRPSAPYEQNSARYEENSGVHRVCC